MASLALAQTVSAQQIAKPLSTLSGGYASGSILCRGGSKVPMTVDAEQALPLKVVAQLDCGQPVSLLSSSDSEGYTVKVRTADGKSGYVAWMNVAKGEVIAPTKSVRQPAVIHDGKARWLAGTEGSQRFYSDGLDGGISDRERRNGAGIVAGHRLEAARQHRGCQWQLRGGERRSVAISRLMISGRLKNRCLTNSRKN